MITEVERTDHSQKSIPFEFKRLSQGYYKKVIIHSNHKKMQEMDYQKLLYNASFFEKQVIVSI
jgi:hypothetical protein